jgi:hypothetical protein
LKSNNSFEIFFIRHESSNHQPSRLISSHREATIAYVFIRTPVPLSRHPSDYSPHSFRGPRRGRYRRRHARRGVKRVVHLADDYGAFVGELVTVGHKAVLHACTIADEVLVGMGAIILDGAEVGARSIIGAGALVTGGTKIPAGSLVLGSPAKVVRSLSLDDQAGIKVWAEKYVALSRAFRERA